ncbi:aminoglycoside phosphotransferase [Pyrenophora tritici-repentis]|nr:aminoglycoside phosphotransferase [Pyrenophora tritici-repentis]
MSTTPDLPKERVITQEEFDNAVKLGGKFAPVFKVDEKTVVKTSDMTQLGEAAAMKMVREKTTIPVPEDQNVYTDPTTGDVPIVMDFIEGDCLLDVWDTYDNDQKQQIIEQLHSYFAQLRELKGSFIGSVDGKFCFDQVFDQDIGGHGPYEDEASFNAEMSTSKSSWLDSYRLQITDHSLGRATVHEPLYCLVKALKNTMISGWGDTVCDMVLAMKDHEIVFTHGDISPRNILVKDCNIVSVLDWEYSGYYPEYWEYAKAFFRPAWEKSWIKDRAVNKILKPYPLENAICQHVFSFGAW